MASGLQSTPPVGAQTPASAEPVAQVASRPMTRCECAGVTFQHVAQQMAAAGSTFEDTCRRTGCGRTCSACLPDLVRYLAGL